MKLKITAIDEVGFLALPEETLRRLGVRPGDWVEVAEKSDGSVSITASDEDFEQSMQIAEAVMVEYHDTLVALGDD